MYTKQVSTEIKGFDEAQGVVEAYANVYYNQDSDGDISMPGSFTKTVSENFKRIRVLKDHDPRIQLGVPLKIDTSDPYGLKTTSQFNLKKEIARDIFSDILLAKQHGLSAELSIGYGKTIRDTKDARKITEYGWLGEYSFLSNWAANEKATVTDIKSLKNPQAFIEMLVKAYDLPASDARLKSIETILQSLEKQPDNSTIALTKSIEQIKSFTEKLTF